jgi:hypothetical protein
MLRAFLVWLLLAAAAARAQEAEGEGCGEGEEDAGITVDAGGGDGLLGVDVDPFDQPVPPDEPNRPPPVEVGTWTPPDMDDAAQREHKELQRLRGESPGDPVPRYRLAELYLKCRWFPQAEAELLAAAQLDPDSIRPWEELLRVYAVKPPDQREIIVRIVQQGGVIVTEDLRGERDWLASPVERNARITNAWQEILRRRPDDVARRREFLTHLKAAGDAATIEAQAREILARLPGDQDTRFDLAEAVRRRGAAEEAARPGAAAEGLAQARALLEENLRANPAHAASALRLARILARLEGPTADARIGELEERAFFHLFVRPELQPVDFRADTLRMARDLAGPQLAGRLWDSVLAPPRETDPVRIFLGEDPRPAYVDRWLHLHFPNPQPQEQIAVLERLARRGDRDAAGLLLAFLWHFEPDRPVAESPEPSAETLAVEAAGIANGARLGNAIYPGAERFLGAATEPRHRRRAAGLVRRLRDPRAVGALAAALAWDTLADHSYGIAAALEELGDASAVAALAEAALDLRRPVPRRREAAEALAAFKDPRAVEATSRLGKEPGLELVAAYARFRLTGDDEALAKLRQLLLTGQEHADVLRLLRKCDDPRLEALLLDALDKAPLAVRPDVVALLRERYWPGALERVKAYALEAARARECSDDIIDLLGELGGADAAGGLLAIVESATGPRWARAARALAETGDARGVRYFSRTRIVDTDPGRRRLAEELYELAAARRAELDRSGRRAGE